MNNRRLKKAIRKYKSGITVTAREFIAIAKHFGLTLKFWSRGFK